MGVLQTRADKELRPCIAITGVIVDGGLDFASRVIFFFLIFFLSRDLKSPNLA